MDSIALDEIRDEIVDLEVRSGGIDFVLSGGSRTPVHPLWLRERTREHGYYDQTTRQRLYEPGTLPENLRIDRIILGQAEKDAFSVEFSDGHKARYDRKSLLAEAGFRGLRAPLPEFTLWDASLSPLPRISWQTAQNEQGLYETLRLFYQYGFVLVEDTPCTDSFIEEFVDRIGILRPTNFGKLFRVENKPDPNDLAYTTLALSMHVDNAYRYPVPGIQILHSLANEVSGGLSTLVNGFTVAEAIRQQNPEAFSFLCSCVPRYRFEDDESEFVHSGPMIECDEWGKLRQVRFTNRVEYMPPARMEVLDGYYRARNLFCRLLNDERYVLQYRLDAGLMVVMDNHRVLHGRTAYDPSEGYRLLHGCYIEHDEPQSRYRKLHQKYGEQN